MRKTNIAYSLGGKYAYINRWMSKKELGEYEMKDQREKKKFTVEKSLN